MRRRALIILGVIFSLAVISRVFAISPQKKTIGSTLIETGTSTKEIMPLLVDIAETQGKYLEYIYGQYRDDYVIIKMKSNGKNKSIEEIEKIVDRIGNNVVVFYPSCEGLLELFRYQTDPWDSIKLEFKGGKIINKIISPSRVEINERIKTQNLITEEQIRQVYDELICALNEGTLEQLRVGNLMDSKGVIEAIGSSPDRIELGTIQYFNKGLEITLATASLNDNRTLIYSFNLFYNDYRDEFSGDIFKKYKGKIIPQLSDKETKKTISEKFGKPDRVVENNAWGRDVYIYKKTYGELWFEFDNNNLLLISISTTSSKNKN